MKKKTLKNSLFIITSTLLLSGCDDKFQTEKSKEISSVLDQPEKLDLKQQEDQKTVISSARLLQEKPVSKNKPSKVIVRGLPDNSSRGAVNMGILATSVVEEEKQVESIILDLSLHLDLMELEYTLDIDRYEAIHGLFEPEEEYESNIDIEAHFEGPHMENKEMDSTPDGAGVEFRIGI